MKTVSMRLLLIGLVAVVILSTLPTSALAQMLYYGSGYNARPYWNKIANPTVVQGQTLSTIVAAVDENGDPLTYTLVQAPTGAALHPATHVFSFTPSYSQLGSFPVTVSVTDGKGPAVTTTFYVNVTTDYGHYVYGGGDYDTYYNQAPYFTSTNSYYSVNSGSLMTFTVTAIDPEGQEVRYSVNGLPAGASFDSTRRQFSWNPERNQRGTYSLSFYATDGRATSVPLTVSIVVDGGVTVNTPVSPAQYYPNYTSTLESNCQFSVAPTTAVAGQLYVYAVRACATNGLPMAYRLLVGPNGASIDTQTGVLTWSVPASAVNQDYQFVVSAQNSAMASPFLDRFAVQVVNGSPEIKTVYNSPKTIVRYLPAPAPVAAPVAPSIATSYYPTNNSQTVVATGRTVVPSNYPYYGATAYGALAALPVHSVPISAFNMSIRASAAKEMIVSWDTNKPTSGEAVFGYASQSRGADLDRTILNYDFTTGERGGMTTRHEISLGQLEFNRTYYLRVISRADTQTDISREVVFIPMASAEGSVTVEQYEGAASALKALGNFLVSGGFLFFLLLVIVGLITYLIILNRRPAALIEGTEVEPHLNFYPEKHR